MSLLRDIMCAAKWSWKSHSRSPEDFPVQERGSTLTRPMHREARCSQSVWATQWEPSGWLSPVHSSSLLKEYAGNALRFDQGVCEQWCHSPGLRASKPAKPNISRLVSGWISQPGTSVWARSAQLNFLCRLDTTGLACKDIRALFQDVFEALFYLCYACHCLASSDH